MAFSQCIRAGISGVAGTVSPEAGAGTVLNRCAPQRQALEASVETMIATMPEAEKAAAREQMRTQLGQIRTQVAAAIRQSRSTSR
jgi:ascorbate-specific PTS system EIIC-type component UlaA